MASSKRSRCIYITGLALLLFVTLPLMVSAAEKGPAVGDATAWSVLPPLVAIALALITKEVYSSLFLGILVGGVLYAGPSFTGVLKHVFVDGIIGSYSDDENVIGGALSDPYDVGILIFLVILGAMVVLMNKSGGSAAFGRWTADKISTREGAQRSTIFMGLMIFVDDYFNCLTVGSVMRPLSDQHNVSRAKLAYLIDSTAAPVCIIAPISSWSAAVSGFAKDIDGINGFQLFMQTIPYNFYALLTIVMMFAIVHMKFDYGPMKKYEDNAKNGDLFTVKDQAAIDAELENENVNTKGKVGDLIIPVAVLIICCLIGMLYTGDMFEGESFIDAFANCDASVSLVFGSVVAIIFTIIFFCVRKIITFKDCMDSLPEGFRAMVPPILILTMAWTLRAMTDSLGLREFVKNSVTGWGNTFIMLFPAIIFLIALVLAFASGTSWGTFGILIPIAISVTGAYPEMTVMSVSACMAGAVCGDHCSPISDTTIMSSAGAGCNHISHVETQIPYALTVAAVACIAYIIAGITKSAFISLPAGIALMIITLYVIRKFSSGKPKKYEADRQDAPA